MEEKATSPAPGGLTSRLGDQFAGTLHGGIKGHVGLDVGGLWAKGKMAQLKS